MSLKLSILLGPTGPVCVHWALGSSFGSLWLLAILGTLCVSGVGVEGVGGGGREVAAGVVNA